MTARSENPERCTLGPLPLDVEAEHYRLGMSVGFYTGEEVIAWADSILASDGPPTPDVIELSLMNHRDLEEISWQLRRAYRQPPDMRLPIARLLEEMAAGVRSGEREPEKVARQLNQVASSNDEFFWETAPEVFVGSEWFTPHIGWEDPLGKLLDLLDRCIAHLRRTL